MQSSRKKPLKETELTGWAPQKSQVCGLTSEQRTTPLKTSVVIITSSLQRFVLTSHADKSPIYGLLVGEERVE